jgi:hypothetical protein
MRTNTKFFISLMLLIVAVIVTLKKPDQLTFITEGMYTNLSLFALIVTAFFTGLFFERRGKGEEKPILMEVSPPPNYGKPYSPQSFPGFDQQQPHFQPQPQYPQPSQIQPPIQQYQPIEREYTKPIDKVPSRFPSLEDLKK